MKRIALFFILCSLFIGTVQSQPAKRRATNPSAGAQKSQSGEQKSDRATLMFPTSAEMPEDVVWRRDIYRQLDLMADKNAPLYYPVEPTDKQVNLFTYLFRLFLTKRLPVYTYKLDGNESFAEKDKVTDVKEILDRYYIYYEEKDGKYVVADNDVPSAQVTRYYIKESSYFDQRTGTYKAKVTALCPVLIEEGYGDASAPKPLFWIKYDDAAPFLSRLPIMSSNFNNVSNMTADDYFTMNRYDGKIYKTANMQGKVLANETDTTKMEAEQKKIEQELVDFEEGIWKHRVKPEPVDSLDSVAAVVSKPFRRQRTSSSAAAKDKEAAVKSGSTRRSGSADANTKEKKTKSKSSGSSAPTVSVRRQRR